jgi:hypothetical protein
VDTVPGSLIEFQGGRTGKDPSIVDQDIDLAEHIGELREHRADLSDIANIGLERDRLLTECCVLRWEMRVVGIVDCHSRSLPSEQRGNSPPDALVCPSNKCGFSREIKQSRLL